MRFEIGPGGGFVVLVGLLGLSAGVFFLGMISGREMARSELEQGSRLATVYPMPAAPAASPSPAAAAAAVTAVPAESSAAVAQRRPHPSNSPIASASTAAAGLPKRLPHPSAIPEHAVTPHPALAGIPHNRATPAASGAAAEARSAESPAPSTQASTREEGEGPGGHQPPPASHHHGYNIVINAAMDRAGADRMVSRLLALGYTSHVVPTQMNGQTWYKVQVGPYPTAEDARAAQEQLRNAYTARYVNRPAAN